MHVFPWSLSVFFVSGVTSLWPQPKEFYYGDKVLWLSPNVEISYEVRSSSVWHNLQTFLRQPFTDTYTSKGNPAVIKVSSRSLLEQLQSDTLLHSYAPWKFHLRGDQFEPVTRDLGAAQITKIEIEKAKKPVFNGDIEAYNIHIAKTGEVSITVNHPQGSFRALKTFSQLFYRHSNASIGVYINCAPVHIQDAPTFTHRGLNLDISRNVITPKDVMRTIEGLSFNKFNRLHLHASDAQSWPLEIPNIPDLAPKGAYHTSQIWSAFDLKEVQSFGAERGIEVYIEIDMPGHTASIQASYPDLIAAFNRKPWVKYSAQPPAGQLKLEDSQVEDFISTLLADLLPRTKSFSSLFHLGGDEITASAYNMTTSELRPHLQAFVDHAINIVHSHGLIPIVWEEHLLDYNLTLPEDTIIQAWRGNSPDHPSALAQLVAQDHKVLFGSNDHWYLDCGHGGWLDPDPNDPSGSPIKSPYLDYCAPLKNWRQVYSYDPLSDIPPKDTHLVIGGEVHLWGEQTDSVNLDTNLWPRVAAAGEIMWNGKGTVSEDTTRRLADMRERLVAMGIKAEPVTVTWCLMNPGNCVL